jgi:hypothetical protein
MQIYINSRTGTVKSEEYRKEIAIIRGHFKESNLTLLDEEYDCGDLI